MTTELTKAAQQALKPCPFCGGKPKRVATQLDERFSYALEVAYVCGCGCRRVARGDLSKGGYADNSKVEDMALSAWNTRAALAQNAPMAATPEPLIVKGAMAGMVDAQVRDLWPTKGAALAAAQAKGDQP